MKNQLKKWIAFAFAAGMLAASVLVVSAGGTKETFDAAYYAKMNPDVVEKVGTNPAKLWKHHEKYGRYEGREAYDGDTEAKLRQLFDAEDYAKFYPDVKAAFGNNKEAMFKHYLAYGLLEARCPSKEVSPAAAKELKRSVEKAMTDAGLKAVPGSLEIVRVLTGDTNRAVTTKNAAKKAEALALQTALKKVQEVVTKAITGTAQGSASKTVAGIAQEIEAKAVTETVKEEQNSKPAAPSNGLDSNDLRPLVHPDRLNNGNWVSPGGGFAYHQLVDFDIDGRCKLKFASGAACNYTLENFRNNCITAYGAPRHSANRGTVNDPGTCRVCGAAINAGAHMYFKGEWRTDSTYHWECTFEGCTAHREKHKYNGAETTLGNIWTSKKCEVCGAAGTKTLEEIESCTNKDNHKTGEFCNSCGNTPKAADTPAADANTSATTTTPTNPANTTGSAANESANNTNQASGETTGTDPAGVED